VTAESERESTATEAFSKFVFVNKIGLPARRILCYAGYVWGNKCA